LTKYKKNAYKRLTAVLLAALLFNLLPLGAFASGSAPQNAALVAQLSTEEKIKLSGGADLWHSTAVDRLGIPAVTFSDGPHGVRKVTDGATLPGVCFPTASLSACSWDVALLEEMGRAIGGAARAAGVNVLLVI
jgi:beta-glucosidase